MKMQNVEDIYALSPMQELMLLHTLSAPQSSVLCEQMSFELRGELDVAAFKSAWQQVVRRHTMLRTAFLWEGLKRPVQVVRQQVELPWTELDWRQEPAEARAGRLDALLQRERARGFDLTKAPLLRLTLIHMAEGFVQFTLQFHHLLLDGWCLSLLFRDVFAFYNALRSGQPADLEPQSPYRDYITWLQRQDLARAEQFWRAALAGYAAPPALSIERAAPARDQEERYEQQRIQLSEATTGVLQRIIQKQQITLGTLIQGVWVLILSCLAGRDDLVFGTVVSGRPVDLPGADTVVGPFINNLPVRVRLAPAAELFSWLKDIQRQQVELRQYEYSPLAQVQGWSEIPQGRRLFDTLVIVENYPVDAALDAPSPGLEIGDLRGGIVTNYPLTLVTGPAQALALQLTYDSNRFDAADVLAVLGSLRAVLEIVAAQPEQKLGDLQAVAARYLEAAAATRERPAAPSDAALSAGQPVAGRPAGLGAPVLPRDAVELQLAQIWETLLGVRPVGVTDNFFELGGQSLLVLLLLDQIQQQFGQRLPLSALLPAGSIEQIAAALRQRPGSRRWSPLLPIQPAGSRRPFFCVHPVTGSALCYLSLAHHLGPDQPFYGLQARGVDGEGVSSTAVEEMASEYIGALRQVQPSGPYLLGGHCSGGLVAFEMAQQLRRQGEEVDLLAVFDVPPPIMQTKDIEVDDNEELASLVTVLAMFFGKDVTAAPDELERLEADSQLSYTLDRLKAINYIPQDARPEHVRALLDVSKANRQAYYTYTPRFYDGEITLFRASEVPEGRYAQAEIAAIFNDPALCWDRFTPRPVDVHRVPGDHVTMLTEPQVQVFAAKLRACLERVQAAAEGLSIRS